MDNMEDSKLISDLKKVIEVTDNLRDLGLQEYITLPKIVVVGQQSSGKSSLLQQIVGIDFLPRGSGVVTRRPLQLRLTHTHSGSPYAKFKQIPNKNFSDFSQVKRTIQELTDKICGKQKAIVDQPIILNVYSTICPNLTLVDLPGLTRIPIQGQPKNIYQITENMIRRYIKDQKTIILCVVAANQDLSTSQAIQLVRQIDTKGERTLGCLTKIDIMDRGTNARDSLLNKTISFKLGYVGIKCRSQLDINLNRSVKQSLEQEKKFFTTSPVYASLPHGTTGTANLTNKLANLLYKHIKKCVPLLFKQLNTRLYQLDGKLQKLGPAMPQSIVEKINAIWSYTDKFLKIFKGSIEGTCENIEKITIEPIGPKIRQIMHEFYKEEYYDDVRKLFDDSQVLYAIKLYGSSIPGFLSIDAFMYLLVPLLKKLRQPAQIRIGQVNDILQKSALSIINFTFDKYPKFKEDFKDFFLNLLQEHKRKTIESIVNLINSQSGFIFTNNSTYLTNSFDKRKKNEKKSDNIEISRNEDLIFQLKNRVGFYYRVVVRNLRDTATKQMAYFMTIMFEKELRKKLCEFISTKDKIDSQWIHENPDITNERAKIKKQYDTLKNAQLKIKKDSTLFDFSSTLQMKKYEKKNQSLVSYYHQFEKATEKVSNMFRGKQQIKKEFNKENFQINRKEIFKQKQIIKKSQTNREQSSKNLSTNFSTNKTYSNQPTFYVQNKEQKIQNSSNQKEGKEAVKLIKIINTKEALKKGPELKPMSIRDTLQSGQIERKQEINIMKKQGDKNPMTNLFGTKK